MTRPRRIPLLRRWRKTKLVLKALLILVAAGLFIRYVAVPIVWRVQANSLASQYEENPTPELADRLAVMLDREAFSRDRGAEVLELLFRPRVVQRRNYPVGIQPVLKLARPGGTFHEHHLVEDHRRIYWDGRQTGGGESVTSGSPGLRGSPAFMVGRAVPPGGPYSWFLLNPKPSEPGIYSQTDTYEIRLVPVRKTLQFSKPPPWHSKPWRWIPLWLRYEPYDATVDPAYEAKFEVSTHVVMASESEADVIELVSDPELDAAMKEAVTLISHPGAGFSSSSGASLLRVQDGLELRMVRVPENVVWRMRFRLPGGQEVRKSFESPFEPNVVHRGESSSEGVIFGEAARLLPAGTQTLTIRLEPDLEGAYSDPEIDRIYGRTLELDAEIVILQNTFYEEPEEAGAAEQ